MRCLRNTVVTTIFLHVTSSLDSRSAYLLFFAGLRSMRTSVKMEIITRMAGM